MEKETNQQMDELTRQYELLKKETDRLTIKNKRQIEDIMHTKTASFCLKTSLSMLKSTP